MTAISSEAKSSWLNTKRGRILIENLTAYLFLAPATLIIFIFGLFPVAFAFFVSLHEWQRFPEEYRGLDSYVEAIGNLAYVVFFWIALAAAVYGIYALWRMVQDTGANKTRPALALIIPGAALAAALFAFINWFFLLLLKILDVPVRLQGQEKSTAIFVAEFLASFRFEEVLTAANTMWLVLLVALTLTGLFLWLMRVPERTGYLMMAWRGTFALGTGFLLAQLTWSEMQVALAEAQAAGASLPIWSQIIFISTGAALIGFALWFWNHTVNDHAQQTTIPRFVLIAAAIVGAVMLIMYLPPALADADKDVIQGFKVATLYAIFSVPITLALGLALAVLLYQNIRAKSLFRVIYFLPYITPFVATSIVFSLLFSHRTGSPANQFIGFLGQEPQRWLLEPKGIFQLLLGDAVPNALAGPGLALCVIILYSVWTYAGYGTVIFLAGLGNIPTDVYESAKIDGANGWQQFRHMTLPLLSPVTFFLLLVSTIGTLQAFTQIYLMRRAGAYTAVDTINIYIYEEITAGRPDYAFGSAMAFVLFGVILVLTLIQNRIAGRRVFYG
jgi:ABC-type sugar transport system permease subunit